MIRLRGQLVCMTDAESAAVRAHVGEHTRLTREEPGCIFFAIDPTDDPLVFEVTESFCDRASFDAHQTRTRDSQWFAATRGILRNFRIEDIGD